MSAETHEMLFGVNVDGLGILVADLGASGSFCPWHELLAAGVFFYNFGLFGRSSYETNKCAPSF